MDTQRLRELAESAERRAQGLYRKFDQAVDPVLKAGWLNDFFYWSGKATSYRGVVAMIELQTVVDDELDSEPTCP
jgi:hypothetical protein